MQTMQLSLGDLIRAGMTGDAKVLGGQSGLSRPVAWVNAISSSQLQGYRPAPAEFVLLVPPYSGLHSHLLCLEQSQCAGVGLLPNELASELLAWADRTAFPIVELQDGTDVASLQRRLLRLVFDAQAGFAAREAEIYQQLTRLSMENRGIGAIASALAEITRAGVLIHDKRLEVLASVPPPESADAWAKLVEWLNLPANMPSEASDRQRAALVQEPIEQALPGGDSRLLIPIIVQTMARGFLSIVKPSSPFNQLDRVAAKQGAAACAIEMSKVKAVSEARKRLTGDLVEAVLSNSVTETDAARWADRAGYRRAGPHVAMALQWTLRDAPTLRRLETLVSGEVKRMPGRVMAHSREDELAVFFALDPERGLVDAQRWAEQVHGLAESEFPSARLAFGIGRSSDTLLGLRHSYHEAAQAMALEHKLRRNHPLYFGDLGIYRLLLQLDGSRELHDYAAEILGSIIAYDQTQNANLLETLRIYFQNNANLAQTAQALYIHRNTLLYRLQRASEIGKFELDNPETRLAIQLALRAHELSRDDGDFLPPL